MPDDPQAVALTFLSDPRNHGGAPVRRIDTSCAVVFLAGDRAYKIKRAVDLGYLDFRRFETRLKTCETELVLNRRTAPMLYRGLAMITCDAAGHVALDGPGEAVEPVVVMTRFADDALGTAALAKGLVDRPMIQALGGLLRRYHAGCPILVPAPMALRDRLEQCLGPARLMVPEVPAARIDALDAALRAAFAAIDSLVQERAAAGWWRRGHGDLHLANTCVIDGVLVPFDALEFDDELASGDVLYDLAFLVMDLRRMGRADLALALFDAYGDHGPQGPRLMPAFIALRALIRAFVTHAGWRAHMEGAPPIATIDAFLREAEDSLATRAPRLIAVGGLSGTGKSTLARALAPCVGPAPGALQLRSDVIRKQLAGAAEAERLPAAAYTPESGEAVYAALITGARHALAQGRSVILDAVFARPAERAAAAGLAVEAGVRFDGLWLQAPLDVRQDRIATRVGDASDATPAVAAGQEAFDIGPLDWQRIDAGSGQAAMLAQAAGALAV